MRARTQRVIPAVLAVLLPLGAACQVSRPPGPSSTLHPSAELAARNPADIAVMPVEDAVEGVRLGDLARHMQRRLYEGLIDRNYSPVSLRRVDAVLAAERTGGAVPGLHQLKGKFGEQALLVVRVVAFEERSHLADGRVRIKSEVKLLDATDLGNLWSGNFELEVRQQGTGLTAMEREERRRQAVDDYVAALLRDLPARVPRGTGGH